MTTSIIICADDYALTPGVSKGIRTLAENNRISATSCMTLSPYWKTEGDSLSSLSTHIDVGLHLTLTDMKPLGSLSFVTADGKLPTYSSLFKNSLWGKLDSGEIQKEFERQIEAFYRVMGRLPDFIDGHHHIQQLKPCRDAIFGIIQNHASQWQPYLRSSYENIPSILKRHVAILKSLSISLAGLGLKREIKKRMIFVNDGFTGVYDFSSRLSYEEYFKSFLTATRNKTLLMCHPGFNDDLLEKIDSLTEQREKEFNYLMSAEFLKLLSSRDIRIARFSSINC